MKGNYRVLIAAETANCSCFHYFSSSTSFRIPFAASEALFYDIITAKGFSFMADIDVGFFMKNVAYSLVWINILASYSFCKIYFLHIQFPSNNKCNCIHCFNLCNLSCRKLYVC